MSRRVPHLFQKVRRRFTSVTDAPLPDPRPAGERGDWRLAAGGVTGRQDLGGRDGGRFFPPPATAPSVRGGWPPPPPPMGGRDGGWRCGGVAGGRRGRLAAGVGRCSLLTRR